MMIRKSKFLFFAISLAELLLAGILGMEIFEWRQRDKTFIATAPPIAEDVIVSSPSSTLKYFYEPKPNQVVVAKENWLPEETRGTVNADSLFERFDYSVEKPPGTFRIITLGDSFTRGWGVNTAENYPEILEDLLNSVPRCGNIKKFEVINLGVAGYDIEYAAERLRIRGIKYDPDLVIWLLKHDDFKDINEVIVPAMREYKAEMERTGELAAAYQKGEYYPYVMKARARLQALYGEEGRYEYYTEALNRIKQYYQNGLIILTFRDHLREKQLTLLRNFANSRNGTYLLDDITNIYNQPRLRQSDYHPNRAGYAQIAQDVFDFLVNKEFIPCSTSAEGGSARG